MRNDSLNRAKNADAALYIMIGTVLVGIVLGTLAYSCMPSDLTDIISGAGMGFAGTRSQMSAVRIFLNSFAVSSLFLGVEFILGFFAFGQLPEFLVLAFRGMGLGVVLSQIYNDLEGTRLFCGVMMIVPNAVISVYALACCAKYSVRLSSRIMIMTFSGERCEGQLKTVKSFSVTFITLEVLTAAAAAVDCLCSVCFADKII